MNLNTHFVANAGLGGVVIGLLADPNVTHAFVSFLPQKDADIASHTLVLVGAIAAYLGRPKTVVSQSAPTPTTVTPSLSVNEKGSFSIMATNLKALTGPLADYVITELEANKPAALVLIQNAEGGVEGAIANAMKNAPRPRGIIGIAVPMVESAIDKYAADLVIKYGPEVVFEFIDHEAHIFAAQLGG